jgi:hypothetical protein
VEFVSNGPLWVEQPISIRISVHQAPDFLYSIDDLQSAWASSVPYLSATYSISSDGHTIPVNHSTQCTTQLCNPNIILSVSEEEKEKYLLCLVYETSISVDRQYQGKQLQLEVLLIYSNSEEGDVHSSEDRSNLFSSDMERNIRTLMDFNRQGKSLDAVTYRSLHAPDRSVIRQVSGKIKLLNPLHVDIRCRELTQDTAIVSVDIQNIAKDHVISLQNVQLNLNHSVIDMERLWESILLTHKCFVQSLKSQIQDLIVNKRAGDVQDETWEEQLQQASWLNCDFVNNPCAMYVDETFDTFSSIDGTSTIAPTQAPLLYRNHHLHNNHHMSMHLYQPLPADSLLVSQSQLHFSKSVQGSDVSSSSATDFPRALSLPSFQVTPYCHFFQVQLRPGEGKSLVYRIDRSARINLGESPLSVIPTLDELLTSYFPYLSTLLYISWQPGECINTVEKAENKQDKFVIAMCQQKVSWSLGASCLPHVYQSLFASLYPVPSISSMTSLTALSPLFDPRYHTEVLHRLHRIFLFGPNAGISHGSNAPAASQPLSQVINSVFSHVGKQEILNISVEGSGIFQSTMDDRLRQITVILHNPHRDLWLRDLILFTDSDLLQGEGMNGEETISGRGSDSSLSYHKTNRMVTFHPSSVSIGNIAPLEKRAVVLHLLRTLPSSQNEDARGFAPNANAMENSSASTQAASVFGEEFAPIHVMQFAIEVTTQVAPLGPSKRLRFRQVTPLEVVMSYAP